MSDILSSDVKRPMEEHDLSKDMCKISVTTDGSNETSPSLSDVPVDVVSSIIERSKYKEQLILRKVSKSLRALVDKLKPACKSIEVVFWYGSISIEFDGLIVTYKSRRFKDDYGIIVIRDDFEKTALDDLASTLKNPKLQLEELSVCFGYSRNKDIEIEKCCNEIRNVLESLNHRVSVKEINLQGSIPSCLLSILPYLKPGVLENISLVKFELNSQSTEMDQIARLEQWKKAEKLGLWRSFDGFQMKYATHFKRFKIEELLIDEDKFNRIKNFLSKLDNFEQCILSSFMFSVDSDLINELFGAPVSSSTTEEIFHHPIPDSDYYLEFKKKNNSRYVEIVKKKRESH